MASSYEFVSLLEDIVSENSNSSRTISCNIIHFVCSLLDEFGACLVAQCFIGFFDIDTLCDCHAIMGNSWSAVLLADDDIASFWTHCGLDGIIKHLRTTEYPTARFFVVKNYITHMLFTPYQDTQNILSFDNCVFGFFDINICAGIAFTNYFIASL